MIDTSNPAGRLHSLMLAAKNCNERQKVRAVWAKVLECDESDDADISRRVVALYELSREVQTLIRLIPDLNYDLYLDSFGQIEKAIFPLNLNAEWKGQRGAINETILTRLQFCADELAKHYSEESVSDDDLKDIRLRVDELFEMVHDSGIPKLLRLALLEELERIRSAISMFRIKGAKGVKEAMQATLGAVVANQEEFAKAKDSSADVLVRLGELLDKLDSFTSKALKLHRILTKPVMAAITFFGNALEQDTD